jgi:hypothetical protein
MSLWGTRLRASAAWLSRPAFVLSEFGDLPGIPPGDMFPRLLHACGRGPTAGLSPLSSGCRSACASHSTRADALLGGRGSTQVMFTDIIPGITCNAHLLAIAAPTAASSSAVAGSQLLKVMDRPCTQASTPAQLVVDGAAVTGYAMCCTC